MLPAHTASLLLWSTRNIAVLKERADRHFPHPWEWLKEHRVAGTVLGEQVNLAKQRTAGGGCCQRHTCPTCPGD